MTSWKKLRHANGPATTVPTHIERLLTGSAEEREDALRMLEDMLLRPGCFYSATAPALALLLNGLDGAREPELALTFAANALAGGHTSGWLSDGPLPEEATPALAVVQEHADALLQMLGGKQPGARSGAALLLSIVDSRQEQTLSAIEQGIFDESDVIAKASMLLALGRLAAGAHKTSALALLQAASAQLSASGDGVVSDDDAAQALVVGAAALAVLRAQPGRSLADEASGIEAWLSYRPVAGERGMPWFRDGRGYYVSYPGPRALVQLARHRDEEEALAELAADIGRDNSDGVVALQVGELLLDLGTLAQLGDKVVVPLDALDDTQRAMARRLAAGHLLPAGGFGLPASGVCRRRWCGIEPAGAIDRPVSVELDGAPTTMPLWRAWVTLQDGGAARGRGMPAAIDAAVAGADRWQAVVEYVAFSYRRSYFFRPEEIDQLVAELPDGQEALSRVVAVADDLAARAAAIAREGHVPSLARTRSAAVTALLFTPLVRADLPMEERWEPLIALDKQPHARAVIEHLDMPRRIALLTRRLAGGAVGRSARLRRVLNVVDLAPAVRPLLLQQIELLAAEQPAAAERYRNALPA